MLPAAGKRPVRPVFACLGLQPSHVSFEPAWAILEHELAAQIHITMKQYFHKLKQMEPDNAFRPDILVRCSLSCCLHTLSPPHTLQ